MRTHLKAFTLVELIIVVLILAIIGAVAIPMAIGDDDSQCEAAARTVIADLELAQSTALARQASVAMVFDDDGRRYKVVLAESQDLNKYDELVALEHPLRPGDDYEVDLVADLRLGDVAITTSSFAGDPYVVFDSFGSPDVGGTVVLEAGDAVLTVSVEAITGAVSVN